jgi:hypothetical protein
VPDDGKDNIDERIEFGMKHRFPPFWIVVDGV